MRGRAEWKGLRGSKGMKWRRGEHHSAGNKGIGSLLLVFLVLREGMLLLRALKEDIGRKGTLVLLEEEREETGGSTEIIS